MYRSRNNDENCVVKLFPGHILKIVTHKTLCAFWSKYLRRLTYRQNEKLINDIQKLGTHNINWCII